VLLALLVVPLAAAAHDVGLELTANGTRASGENPRTGSAGLTLVGSVDATDALSFLGSFGLTRDFATRTSSSSSTGSTIPLATLGTMVLPTDNTMLMLSAVWGPASQQDNATTVHWVNPKGDTVSTDVTVRSLTSSFGLQLAGAWMSGGDGPLESSLDVSLGATRYVSRQQLLVPDTLAGRALTQRCATTPGDGVCLLVAGAETPLLQARLGGGYTVTVKDDTDVTVDAAVYLYDQDPAQVGYFSLVMLGRAVDLGNGVPVLPFFFTARFSGVQRLGKLTLKLSYQAGVYASALGVNHLLAVRATYKLGELWRLTAMVAGQGDGPRTGVGLANQGGSALLSLTAVF